MTADVVITSVAARTPLGLTAEASAAAVRAGISRVQEHPFLIDATREPLLLGFDRQLDPSELGWRRLVSLGSSPLLEAATSASRSSGSPSLTVLVALPAERPGFSADDLRRTLRGLRDAAAAGGVRVSVELAGTGHAGTLRALQVAAEAVARGEHEFILVGGVESYLEPDTLEWLESDRRLAIEGVRGGFHPGEGAAFLVVASGEVARRLGLTPLGRLRGAASSLEERSFAKDVEVLGQGLAASITGAVSALDLPREAVDAVWCDINGERWRTEEWGMAILRTQHAFRHVAYEAPADLWGDVGAASGALGCMLALRAWQRDYARGPRALVWASSDDGLRAAAVLEQPAR